MYLKLFSHLVVYYVTPFFKLSSVHLLIIKLLLILTIIAIKFRFVFLQVMQYFELLSCY